MRIGVRAVLTIVGVGLVALAGLPPATAGAPCCNVTGVNNKTAVVTATDRASGKSFSFKVNDKAMLKGLKTGDPVTANFASGQVSLPKHGASPCCSIIAGPQIKGSEIRNQ